MSLAQWWWWRHESEKAASRKSFWSKKKWNSVALSETRVGYMQRVEFETVRFSPPLMLATCTLSIKCDKTSPQKRFVHRASPTSWAKRRVSRKNAIKPLRVVELGSSLGACVLGKNARDLGPRIWQWSARLWVQKGVLLQCTKRRWYELDIHLTRNNTLRRLKVISMEDNAIQERSQTHWTMSAMSFSQTLGGIERKAQTNQEHQ